MIHTKRGKAAHLIFVVAGLRQSSRRPFSRRSQHGSAQAASCRLMCSTEQHDQSAPSFSRRSALLALSTAPLLGSLAAPAHADPLELAEYRDGPDEFSLMVPADWTTGQGQADGAKFGGSTGARRALAWCAPILCCITLLTALLASGLVTRKHPAATGTPKAALTMPTSP